MIINDEPKTTSRQRVLVVAIAIFMLISTFMLYAGAVMSSDSSSTNSTVDSAKQARFTELYQKYQDAVSKQSDELSGKYFEEFLSYKSRVKAFNAADVDEVKTKDLKVGDGAEVPDKEFTDYAAYYIGWLSDESIFDSSFDSAEKPTKLKTPLAGTAHMIEGWLAGLVGMKIGGVREITIPAELGYGSTEQASIPANSPLKFVVMLIDPVQEPEFDEAEELKQLIDELYN